MVRDKSQTCGSPILKNFNYRTGSVLLFVRKRWPRCGMEWRRGTAASRCLHIRLFLMNLIIFLHRYSTSLAAANVPLAHLLTLHLGDLTKENFVLLETHNGDGRVAEFLLKSFPSIQYIGGDFSSEMNSLCQKRIKSLMTSHVPKVRFDGHYSKTREQSLFGLFITIPCTDLDCCR
jgi:hypothetical protein